MLDRVVHTKIFLLPAPADDIPLLDWYHTPYLKIIKEILTPGASPLFFSDNNLINGKGNFNCST